ncbi:MAG: O-acetyl-ADP-ribose deacetylase [Acidobacteriota bacterium]|jgi:O-acetyl-ADP-ribose deacetylase (regulator of RNase III)|nr:O-acetyl-ADP-ribose deacetylase [Acidobacteriota bacterium]
MTEFMNGRVSVLVGDITLQTVDAIVNAANSALLGGGGVDGAIHRAGGSAILTECRELRRTRYPEGLPVGEAVATTAGKLRARFVIHTVGPVYGRHNGREPELLAACYLNSLRLADENDLRSIAFPAISTGAFGYPREEAARVASETISNYLTTGDATGDGVVNVPGDQRVRDGRGVQEIRLVFFSQRDAELFVRHHSFYSAQTRLRKKSDGVN